jgi:hypothetical protein
MDPYLEQHWRDVHHRLVTYASDQLQPRLPRDLRARVEERVYVESEAAEPQRSVYPDVRVVETRPRRGEESQAVGVLEVSESVVIHLANEPVTEGYLQIIDVASGGRIVTVIEFLSATNKTPGEGQDLYLRKQREVQEARASLVEVDLVRTGRWVLAVSADAIPGPYRTTYQVCVRRGWNPSEAQVYRAPLRARLPVIAVPLREKDAEAALDLQSLVDQAYHNGAYDDLDYRAELRPPLVGPDAAWVDELLRSKGLR